MGESEVRHRPSKSNNSASDPFGPFDKATRMAFAFLVQSSYSVEEGEPILHPPECSINYLNKTTGVTVSYEWGGAPSVVLTKLKPGTTDISEGEQIGLKFLAMERGPASIDRFDRGVIGNLEEILKDYAHSRRMWPRHPDR